MVQRTNGEPNLLDFMEARPPEGVFRVWFYKGQPRNPTHLERPRWVEGVDVLDKFLGCRLIEELSNNSEQGKEFDGALLLNHRGQVVISCSRSQGFTDPRIMRLPTGETPTRKEKK